jgi:adenosylmethionine-8-amino-7-oxononanoate aminotransferase
MCHGPETVAAFIAEPVSGTSLCGATPREDYFKRIRAICDNHNVLLILDEVMTGFGRTGKWFGYEHFGIKPDIMAMGKGLGGGYFPIGAAAVSAQVAEAIAKKSGLFAAGFSWAGNPMGTAIVSKAIDYLKQHKLVERCNEIGIYLSQKLEELKHHPTVGDVRGMGLMRGLEFVTNKETKKPLDPNLHFSIQLAMETLKRGLAVQFSAGCDRGQAGDMIFLGPPFIIAKDQIDDLVAILDASLTEVEKTNGFV